MNQSSERLRRLVLLPAEQLGLLNPAPHLGGLRLHLIEETRQHMCLLGVGSSKKLEGTRDPRALS